MKKILSSAVMLSVIFCAAVSCSTQKESRHGYLCKEHGYHRATVKDEFAACFGITTSDIDNYYIFEKENTVSTSADIDPTASRLKGIVADEIVDLIMKRLEAAYGSELTAHWHLESIDISVPFRRFVMNDGAGFKVKVIALMKKDDLSPRSLIRFLPLEYKMNLVEPTERERRQFKNVKP